MKLRFTQQLFLIIILLSLSYKAKADHCAGGELTYEWVHDATYRVTLKFYKDCRGIAAPATVKLCYNNTCNADEGSIDMPQRTTALPDGRVNGSEVSTGCPGFPSNCSGGTIPGFREYWYETEVTLPSKCNYWRFFICLVARNNAININGGNFYLEATLDNEHAEGNSSPTFTVAPVPYVGLNQPYTYNNGVVDIDKDSLAFDCIVPQTATPGCSNPPLNSNSIFFFRAPPLFIPNNPFQTNNTYVLNRVNGSINFTPAELGTQATTMRVKEYRNGRLIGSVLRDVTIQVLAITLAPINIDMPPATFSGSVYDNPNIEICQGQAFHFCFDVKSKAGTVLVVRDNHGYSIPNATLTYTNMGTDSVRGCFSWSPQASDTTLKTLSITVKDSTCLPPGVAVSQTFTLPIHTNLSAQIPTVLSPVYRCLNTVAAPLTAGAKNLLWYTSSTGGTGSANPIIPSTSSLGSTTYYVAQYNGCTSPRVPIEVIVAPNLNAKIIGAKDTLCQYDNVTLSNYTPHLPGFHYNWSLDTGTIKSRDTTGFITVSWATAGLKKITLATSNNICESYDSVYLFVKPKAIAAFELPETGCVDEEIMLTPKQTLPASYHWTITEQVINDTVYVPRYQFKWHNTGLKTVTLDVRSNNGCNPYIDTQTIYINENPPAHITLATDKVCLDDELTLSTVRGADYIYGWSPAEYFNNNNYYEATMHVERSTKVYVSVSNRWGCVSRDSIDLNAGLCCKILMPDAFSPNGDGHNDVYNAIGIENHTIRSFFITNRWGQTIFSTTDNHEGWNGNFKHTAQPTDTYFYYIKYTCDDGNTFEKKGSFVLLR